MVIKQPTVLVDPVITFIMEEHEIMPISSNNTVLKVLIMINMPRKSFQSWHLHLLTLSLDPNEPYNCHPQWIKYMQLTLPLNH